MLSRIQNQQINMIFVFFRYCTSLQLIVKNFNNLAAKYNGYIVCFIKTCRCRLALITADIAELFVKAPDLSIAQIGVSSVSNCGLDSLSI